MSKYFHPEFQALLETLPELEAGFREFWTEKRIPRGIMQDAMRDACHAAWVASREHYLLDKPPVCRTPEASPCAAIPFLRLAILREVLSSATLTDYNLGKWLREEIEKEVSRERNHEQQLRNM